MALDPCPAKDLFLAAITHPNATARHVFLDRACAADAALRGRVEARLDRPTGGPAVPRPPG